MAARRQTSHLVRTGGLCHPYLRRKSAQRAFDINGHYSRFDLERLEARRLLTGVTIITHGGAFDDDSLDDWVDYMAEAARDRIVSESGGVFGSNDVSIGTITVTKNGTNPITVTGTSYTINPTTARSGEVVLKLDWSSLASWWNSTTTIAEAVGAALISNSVFPGLNFTAAGLPIHLIGHSRGGSLVAALAEVFGQEGIWVDQVTTLDPYPLFDYDYGDWPDDLTPTENVVFADNYHQPWVPAGQIVDGAYNRDLTGYLDGGSPLDHSDVRLWYQGTIDTTDSWTDGIYVLDQDMRDDWYATDEGAGSLGGAHYSRIAQYNGTGGDRNSSSRIGGSPTRIREGYSREMGGGRNFNKALDWSDSEWANLLGLTIDGGFSHQEGSQVTLRYTYADYNRRASIEFYLDEDANPLNGMGSRLGGTQQSSTGVHARNGAFTWDTTGFRDDGESRFIGARISNGTGHTRYFYVTGSFVITPPDSDQGSALQIYDLDWWDTSGGGDGDGIMEAGERVGLEIRLRNTSSRLVTDIQGWLVCGDSDVFISPSQNTWDNAYPGDIVTDGDNWTVELHFSDTRQEFFSLVVQYWSEGTLYYQAIDFNRTFYDPNEAPARPVITGWRWIEESDEGGNTLDGIPQSGEFGKLAITFSNGDDEEINNLEAWLTSDTQWATVSDHHHTGYTIDPGDSEELTWDVNPHRAGTGALPITVHLKWSIGNTQYESDLIDAITMQVGTATWPNLGTEDEPPLDDNVVDFGPVSSLTPIEWTFYVENQGTEKLRLTGIEVSNPSRLTWIDDGTSWNVLPQSRKYFTVTLNPIDFAGPLDVSIRVLSANGRYENDYYLEDTIHLRALVGSELLVHDVPDVANAALSDVGVEWVTWWESRSGQDDIFAYNTASDQAVRITDDAFAQWNPRISGTLVVWEDRRNDDDAPYVNRDIYGYDLAHPEGGMFAISSSSYNEELIGVDGKLVAYIQEYHTWDTNNWQRAANIIVKEYQADGSFVIVYNSGFTWGGGTSDMFAIEDDGDFGGGLLVYEAHTIFWNTRYQYWDSRDQHIEVIDFLSPQFTPRRAITGWSTHEAAVDPGFAYTRDDSEGEQQIWFWHDDGGSGWTEQLTTGEYDHGEEALAAGDDNGRISVVFDTSSSTYPGLYYLDIASKEMTLLNSVARPDYESARMDRNITVWVDFATHAGVRYAYLYEADLVVRDEDIRLVDAEPVQNQPTAIEVDVRNVSTFDLKEDALIGLYDADGNLFATPVLINSSLLKASGKATARFEDVRFARSNWQRIEVRILTDDSYRANNSASKDIYVFDDDSTGPAIEDFTISEYGGNNDSRIDAGERVLITWRLSDPSGVDVDSIRLTLDDRDVQIHSLSDGRYWALAGPLAAAMHEAMIRADDLDDTPGRSREVKDFVVTPIRHLRRNRGRDDLSPGDDIYKIPFPIVKPGEFDDGKTPWTNQAQGRILLNALPMKHPDDLVKVWRKEVYKNIGLRHDLWREWVQDGVLAEVNS